MIAVCWHSVSKADDTVFIGKVKSVQFECMDNDEPFHDICSGKVQVKSKNKKTIVLQLQWQPAKEKLLWLYSTKELTFSVEQLEHTTEYGLLRQPEAK